VHAQNAPDTDRVETAVMDETPNRLGMHPELSRDFANAVQRFRLRRLRLER
jgi:hypothetical protein